jgi:hypothetical protein
VDLYAESNKSVAFFHGPIPVSLLGKRVHISDEIFCSHFGESYQIAVGLFKVKGTELVRPHNQTENGAENKFTTVRSLDSSAV